MSDKQKSKKKGRNSAKCKAYRAEGRREVNKAKRLYRHLSKHPNDQIARAALDGGSVKVGRGTVLWGDYLPMIDDGPDAKPKRTINKVKAARTHGVTLAGIPLLHRQRARRELRAAGAQYIPNEQARAA